MGDVCLGGEGLGEGSWASLSEQVSERVLLFLDLLCMIQQDGRKIPRRSKAGGPRISRFFSI